MAFKPVSAQVDFVKQEHEILEFWTRTEAFRKLNELRAGAPRWSFIDGPITHGRTSRLGAHLQGPL